MLENALYSVQNKQEPHKNDQNSLLEVHGYSIGATQFSAKFRYFHTAVLSR